MSVFVDMNVLVYTRDASEPEKQSAAMSWLNSLWKAREGRLSVQVLQELERPGSLRFRPWDAAMATAGRRLGCSYLLTEDLQAGQDLGGILALDPFASRPEELIGGS